jgi:hypothetical protein
MTILNIQRYYGFKEETQPGIPETEAEMHLDPKSLSPGIPSDTEITYTGSIGRSKNIHRPGPYLNNPTVETGTDIKTLTRLLYFTLGNQVKEPRELYKRVKKDEPQNNKDTEDICYIYGSDNVLLPTFTSFMGLDLNEHIINGCVIDKFELTADKDFINFKLDMKAIKSILKPLKLVSELKLNDNVPLAYFEIDLYLRKPGTMREWSEEDKISYKTQKLTFSIENSIDESSGQHIGSRFASFLAAGERNIKLSFDTLYLDNTWFTYLWSNENGPQEREGSTEVEAAMKINTTHNGSMLIELPRAIITGASFDSSGRDTIVQSVDIDTYQKNIEIPLKNPIKVNTECLITTKTKGD